MAADLVVGERVAAKARVQPAEHAAMRADHALWPAGTSRGVENVGSRVG